MLTWKFIERQLQVWCQGSIHLQCFPLCKKWPQPATDENLWEKAWDFLREAWTCVVLLATESGCQSLNLTTPVSDSSNNLDQLTLDNPWDFDKRTVLRKDFTCSDVLCQVWCYSTLGTCKPPVLALAVNSRWTPLWHYLWVQHPADKKQIRKKKQPQTKRLKTMGGEGRERNKNFPRINSISGRRSARRFRK